MQIAIYKCGCFRFHTVMKFTFSPSAWQNQKWGTQSLSTDQHKSIHKHYVRKKNVSCISFKQNNPKNDVKYASGAHVKFTML